MTPAGRYATPRGAIADVKEPDDNPDHPIADHVDKFAWFRLHVKLAPEPRTDCVAGGVAGDAEHASMNISNTGPGTDVYANGKLVLPEGPHPDDTGRLSADFATLQAEYSSIGNFAYARDSDTVHPLWTLRAIPTSSSTENSNWALRMRMRSP